MAACLQAKERMERLCGSVVAGIGGVALLGLAGLEREATGFLGREVSATRVGHSNGSSSDLGIEAVGLDMKEEERGILGNSKFENSE